jgi:hypothetical protein
MKNRRKDDTVGVTGNASNPKKNSKMQEKTSTGGPPGSGTIPSAPEVKKKGHTKAKQDTHQTLSHSRNPKRRG